MEGIRDLELPVVPPYSSRFGGQSKLRLSSSSPTTSQTPDGNHTTARTFDTSDYSAYRDNKEIPTSDEEDSEYSSSMEEGGSSNSNSGSKRKSSPETREYHQHVVINNLDLDALDSYIRYLNKELKLAHRRKNELISKVNFRKILTSILDESKARAMGNIIYINRLKDFIGNIELLSYEREGFGNERNNNNSSSGDVRQRNGDDAFSDRHSSSGGDSDFQLFRIRLAIMSSVNNNDDEIWIVDYSVEKKTYYNYTEQEDKSKFIVHRYREGPSIISASSSVETIVGKNTESSEELRESGSTIAHDRRENSYILDLTQDYTKLGEIIGYNLKSEEIMAVIVQVILKYDVEGMNQAYMSNCEWETREIVNDIITDPYVYVPSTPMTTDENEEDDLSFSSLLSPNETDIKYTPNGGLFQSFGGSTSSKSDGGGSTHNSPSRSSRFASRGRKGTGSFSNRGLRSSLRGSLLMSPTSSSENISSSSSSYMSSPSPTSSPLRSSDGMSQVQVCMKEMNVSSSPGKRRKH